MKIIKKIFKITLIFLSLILLSINIYGLSQEIEPSSYDKKDLRFIKNKTISYSLAIERLEKIEEKDKLKYAIEANQIIFERMTHISWNEIDDTSKYNQRVPFWENYLIFLMSVITDIPEYKKYHFADYKKSLKRGIGVCGDHAMILNQILNIKSIHNKILTFPGHVVILAQINDDFFIFDPDFGVYFKVLDKKKIFDEHIISSAYYKGGYTNEEVSFLIDGYRSGKFEFWDNTKHFITKKYYFEYISYFMIWIFPLVGLYVGTRK